MPPRRDDDSLVGVQFVELHSSCGNMRRHRWRWGAFVTSNRYGDGLDCYLEQEPLSHTVEVSGGVVLVPVLRATCPIDPFSVRKLFLIGSIEDRAYAT
jgi:hypothetical protein